jgi:hypothetical protein
MAVGANVSEVHATSIFRVMSVRVYIYIGVCSQTREDGGGWCSNGANKDSGQGICMKVALFRAIVCSRSISNWCSQTATYPNLFCYGPSAPSHFSLYDGGSIDAQSLAELRSALFPAMVRS